MKAAHFDYARARDAAHAVSLLEQAHGYAKPIAGGQSLGPMLNLRLARPELLVDIRRCTDLRGVRDEGDALVYGAAVTHAEIEDGHVPDATPGWLACAARQIAYRAVRNRGTMGGSVAHADPAADWLCVLLALNAEAIVQSAAGTRAMRLSEFVVGPFATQLAADEILIGLRVARRSDNARWGYCKLAAKHGEFARAFAVVLDDPQRGERRAVSGAVERVPVIHDDAPALIDGDVSAAALIESALPALDPASRSLHSCALSRALAPAAAPSGGWR
ncbi:MAG: FAD binding domain-containing protein [Gammaproteobacteria bacterium]